MDNAVVKASKPAEIEAPSPSCPPWLSLQNVSLGLDQRVLGPGALTLFDPCCFEHDWIWFIGLPLSVVGWSKRQSWKGDRIFSVIP
jgi:hypothetical protein